MATLIEINLIRAKLVEALDLTVALEPLGSNLEGVKLNIESSIAVIDVAIAEYNNENNQTTDPLPSFDVQEN